jgi:hypothetical protein
VTLPIDSSAPLSFQWSVDILCLSLSVQSYSTFSFRLEILKVADILEVLRIQDPLEQAHINETLKKHLFRQYASFEPSCTFVRSSFRPLCDCDEKILIFFKNCLNKKVTKSLCFTYARGSMSNRLQWRFTHRSRSPT